jgi:uncharacterized membrane protein YfcA
VSANATFSLCAAAGALLVSTLSAVKGRWAVAIVFGLLVAGFLLRALEGRREAAREARRPPEPPPRPQPPKRRIKPARFKRR